MVPPIARHGGVDALRAAASALRTRLGPLADRLRPWVNSCVLRRYLLGDPEPRHEHLQVAGVAGAAAMLGATLLGATPLLVSPVVWDGLLLLWLPATLLAVAANGYWRGGLAAAYALAIAPVSGGLLGAATVGAFTGTAGYFVLAPVAVLLLVPLADGVGHCVRRTREVWL